MKKVMMLVLSVFYLFSMASAYPINKISGFVLNWKTSAVLETQPYAQLSQPISIAFVTNSGTNLYFGGIGSAPLSAAVVNTFIQTSGKPSTDFILSFGGATNAQGWNSFNSQTFDVKTLADNLAAVVNDAGLAGVDIDDDVPPTNNVYLKNVHDFIQELHLKLPGKIISFDLPNTGACTQQSQLPMCITFRNSGSPSYGTAVQYFQGNYNIDPLVSYYNSMNYSWPQTSKALDYSTDSIKSYLELGLQGNKLNIGIDVAESGDQANLNTEFVSGIANFAEENRLHGVFVWDFNTDSSLIAANSYPWGGESIISVLENANKGESIKKTTPVEKIQTRLAKFFKPTARG